MRLFKRRSDVPEVSAPVVAEAAPVLPDPPADTQVGRRVADQRDYLLSLVHPLPAFGMYLLDAWGTAVCEEIIADGNLPAADLAVASGYAVRVDDLHGLDELGSAKLRVRDDAAAFKVGSAVQVRAGQPLPSGADAVIPLDDAALDGSTLSVTRPVRSGDHVRWAGSEVRAGMPIIRSGERLDARRSALLALAGIDRVLARPHPRVVVLSVVGDDPARADIESPLLAAAFKADGAQVWRVSNASGTDRELRDTISDQLIRADLVVVCGDLSDEAQLPRVVASMGLVDMADVACQPGGRMGFAIVGEDEIPLLMLPNEAVEAYCDYQLFARPLLRKLMGAPVITRPMVDYLAGGELRGREGIVSLRLGAVREEQGEKVVVPLGKPDHPRLSDLVSADALIVLDETGPVISLGERVGCWLLND